VSDITKCPGEFDCGFERVGTTVTTIKEVCKRRGSCYRYLARSHDIQQSYMQMPEGECASYWPDP
jgi:hypothetical protein